MGRSLIFLAVCLFLLSCGKRSPLSHNFSYDLEQPEAVYLLPPELKEVSGIEMVDDDLAALIEDNSGDIFFYDLLKRKVTKKVKVAGKGDFEDIALVNNTYYLLRSDGDLFTFTNGRTTHIKSPLGKENNAEGLAYDAENNRLLIALKGDPEASHPETDKEIHSFDLNENKFAEHPVITISLSDFEKYTNKYADRFPFKPSGIAVGPDKGNYFLISSTADVMIKISPEGKILDMGRLNEGILEQPEGICFSKKGDLFITSEGKARAPRIVKFENKG